DEQGRPWTMSALPAVIARNKSAAEKVQPPEPAIIYAWGKRWWLPTDKPEVKSGEPPPSLKDNEFWKGSAFGVAVGARSFPGIIAIHANADYIFNFDKVINVQSQIEELGRYSDSEFVSFLDTDLNIVAHTDRRRIGQREKEPLVLKAKVDRRLFSQIVESGGKRHLEVVKPVAVEESYLGFLKIGLSLGSMEASWSNSVRAILILSLALVAAGILGMAAIFHNQSTHLIEVKALEAEVAHRERLSALGNLAATVAHEVRNPLNAISMGLQRLKLEFHPAEDRDQYSHLTELMLSEAHRLNSIVEQFLSLARPVEINAEALPLEEILKELAELQANDAQRSQVQIRVIAAPDLPPLKADPNYMTQVLLNLMLNGMQAMPEGGTLTLEAKTSKDKFIIAVSDTGPGIAPENLSRVFEPYFSTKPQGSGLGLAISLRIIEAHGGTITVANQADGGCRFEICLPLNGAEV
ncbi:MAG TPA: ATP-binding protein, partial [Candidatus Limnocylindria bacterium]|nr:ATP-binding protein [Candidatus Limnocylindria bacterium]